MTQIQKNEVTPMAIANPYTKKDKKSKNEASYSFSSLAGLEGIGRPKRISYKTKIADRLISNRTQKITNDE